MLWSVLLTVFSRWAIMMIVFPCVRASIAFGCTAFSNYGLIPLRQYPNQSPRCKQRGIKLAALQSSGVFDPRGSRQMCMQACPLGSLLAGIKLSSGIGAACSANCTVRPMRPDMPMTLCR